MSIVKWSAVLVALFCLAFPASLRAAGGAPVVSESSGTWENITAGVAPKHWGYAGVCYLTAVPGSADIIAGVSESGLWRSSDGGKTWKHLGDADKEQITNRPGQIVFDPKDPKTFWVTGCYGAGLFKTTDAGESFHRLGGSKVFHIDGIAIDFTDPQRKTILLGQHEKARSLLKSVDGGTTFDLIGDNLPEASSFSTDPVVIDSHTYFVNSAGYIKKPWAIFRSEDAGKTWEKVANFGPSSTAVQAVDGAFYWGITWAGGIIKSTDQGKSWARLNGPAVQRPFLLSNGWIGGIDLLISQPDKKAHLYLSGDGGKTWKHFGPELPFEPSGLVYSAKGNYLYAWHSTEKKSDLAIIRLKLGS